jgi:hypothetical protein
VIKLSIIIDDAAYEQAKLLAEESGLGVAEWIEELIEDTCEPDELDPISDLQARVTAIENILQSREAAKEEATEVESGSQEDEARCQATEGFYFEDIPAGQYLLVREGLVMEGDLLLLCDCIFEKAFGLIGEEVKTIKCKVYRRKP